MTAVLLSPAIAVIAQLFGRLLVGAVYDAAVRRWGADAVQMALVSTITVLLLGLSLLLGDIRVIALMAGVAVLVVAVFAWRAGRMRTVTLRVLLISAGVALFLLLGWYLNRSK